MTTSQAIQKATRILERGGVIAYPTEGVFGLGCLPDNFAAVARVLDIKQRDPDMGLVLIAAAAEQLDDWIDIPPEARDFDTDSDQAITWIVPATSSVPTWIRGKHAGVAVRVTNHPVAAALCEAADSVLVSTSANVSGRPPTRNALVLRRNLGSLVDYIVPGQCGSASGPSEIRVFGSGEIVRPA